MSSLKVEIKNHNIFLLETNVLYFECNNKTTELNDFYIAEDATFWCDANMYFLKQCETLHCPYCDVLFIKKELLDSAINLILIGGLEVFLKWLQKANE